MAIPGSKIFKEPYLTVNIVFTGLILVIIAYSAIFSPDRNDYPVVCVHEQLTGQPCASCGISHSFSLIVRGRMEEAYEWNPNGMRVFLFFLLQAVMRVVFSLFYLRKGAAGRYLVMYDIAGSVLMFLISFMPFIRSIVSGFFS